MFSPLQKLDKPATPNAPAAANKKPGIDRAEASSSGYAAMASKLAPPRDPPKKNQEASWGLMDGMMDWGGAEEGEGERRALDDPRTAHLLETYSSAIVATINGRAHEVEFGWDVVGPGGRNLSDVSYADLLAMQSAQLDLDQALSKWSETTANWADTKACEAAFAKFLQREAPNHFRAGIEDKAINGTVRLMPMTFSSLSGRGALQNRMPTGPKRAVAPFVDNPLPFWVKRVPTEADPRESRGSDWVTSWDIVGPDGAPLVVAEDDATVFEMYNDSAGVGIMLMERQGYADDKSVEAAIKQAVTKDLAKIWSDKSIGDYLPAVRFRPFKHTPHKG